MLELEFYFVIYMYHMMRDLRMFSKCLFRSPTVNICLGKYDM